MEIQYGSLKGKREIVLTFDDGPNPKTTPIVLDVLKEYQIKGLFFCLGQCLENPVSQSLLERMHNEGHLIGNHTYTHTALTKLSDDQIREEIRKTEKLIGTFLTIPKLIRPPYGATNVSVNKILHEEGYISVLWNVDTLDWKYRSPEWVNHALSQIEAREDSLVLMHDIHLTTVKELDSFIKKIKGLDGEHIFESYV